MNVQEMRRQGLDQAQVPKRISLRRAISLSDFQREMRWEAGRMAARCGEQPVAFPLVKRRNAADAVQTLNPKGWTAIWRKRSRESSRNARNVPNDHRSRAPHALAAHSRVKSDRLPAGARRVLAPFYELRRGRPERVGSPGTPMGPSATCPPCSRLPCRPLCTGTGQTSSPGW